MAEIEFPLDIGFYESNSLPLAAQECVNMSPQNPQTEGALSTGALFKTPGIATFTTTAGGPNRGAHRVALTGVPYVVSGTRLYKVNANGTNTDVGVIAGTSRVSMDSNGVVIAIIVPGEKGYFHNIAAETTAEITDPIFLDFMAQPGGVGSVVYKGGFFAYTTDFEIFAGSANTSDENFGQSFNALDVATAEVSPDKNRRGMTINNELYICGADVIEPFQNVTSSGFPFQRIPGASIDKGLAARFGIVEFDGSAMFVGGHAHDGIGIYRIGAGTAQKKSTAAIDHVLDLYSEDDIESAFAFAWGENGNLYAGFTFPNHTFIFNGTSSAVKGRPVWQTIETDGSRWRVQDIVRAYNKNLVTDNVDGRIGEMSLKYFTNYDVSVPWRMTGAFVESLGKNLTFSSVELVVEAGVGLDGGSPEGVDPQISLAVSDDGARTLIDCGSRSMGRQGEYGKRLIWNRLGDSDFSRVMQFSGNAPVKTALLKLIVDAEVGL